MTREHQIQRVQTRRANYFNRLRKTRDRLDGISFGMADNFNNTKGDTDTLLVPLLTAGFIPGFLYLSFAQPNAQSIIQPVDATTLAAMSNINGTPTPIRTLTPTPVRNPSPILPNSRLVPPTSTPVSRRCFGDGSVNSNWLTPIDIRAVSVGQVFKWAGDENRIARCINFLPTVRLPSEGNGSFNDDFNNEFNGRDALISIFEIKNSNNKIINYYIVYKTDRSEKVEVIDPNQIIKSTGGNDQIPGHTHVWIIDAKGNISYVSPEYTKKPYDDRTSLQKKADEIATANAQQKAKVPSATVTTNTNGSLSSSNQNESMNEWWVVTSALGLLSVGLGRATVFFLHKEREARILAGKAFQRANDAERVADYHRSLTNILQERYGSLALVFRDFRRQKSLDGLDQLKNRLAINEGEIARLNRENDQLYQALQPFLRFWKSFNRIKDKAPDDIIFDN